MTDPSGRYSIIVDAGASLTFSYVGYASQTHAAQPVLNVRLEPSVTGIDEVVVVAYGQQKKASVTGAISQIATRELKQSPVANLSASLAGRLPGLTALQISGQPGVDEVNLYLRGVGTTNGNSPLILIDGVPRSNISSLDPNEVASVSILKDASATAVFGVRGANGVVLITTKRGSAGGRNELSISFDRSAQQFTIDPPRVHSWEYAALVNEAQRNGGLSPVYTDYQIQKYKDGSDRVFYPDRYPFEEFYKTFAPQTRVNANLSGGTGKLMYFINAGFISQGSNLKTEPQSALGYDPSFSMNRYNFRGNLDFQPVKNLKLSINLASYLQKTNAPQRYIGDEWAMQQLLGTTLSAEPTEVGPLTVAGYTTPEGTPVPEGEVVSVRNGGIYGTINRAGYRQVTQSVLNSSFVADWGLGFITEGLSTKLMASFDSDASTTLVGARNFAYYFYEAAREEGGQNYYIDEQNAALNNDNIALSQEMNGSYYFNMQYSLNYDREFDDHNVTGLLLFQRDNWDSKGGNLPFNVIGFAGRLTYSYANKYFAEVNLGYNGSEQFAPKNRFGFFPAYSAAYLISNESWWSKDVVSNLKLRASYGLVGNDKMGDVRFLYQGDNTIGGGSLTPSLGRGNTITQGKLGNDAIQWEVSEKMNGGVDLTLWESLTLTADVFNEHRSKILISRGLVPNIQGVPLDNLPRVNMGIVDNKGFEVELAYVKSFSKDLQVNMRGNYAFARNKVVYYDEAQYDASYAARYRYTGYYVEGHATHYADRFGYKIDKSNGSGYITTPEELEWAKGAYDSPNATYGDLLYMDINGDGKVTDHDKVLLAYPTVPEVSFGFSGIVNYKDLDFSFLISGITNCSITNQAVPVRYNEPMYSHAWTQERWDNGESIQYPALKPANNSPSYQSNEFFTFDRTYLRLKTMELGYTLPKAWVKSVGLKNCRLYVNGNNLLTFTKFPFKTIDPEQASIGDYPIQKMYNVGVSVLF
jgi:TonB-linked SusC/RagA family outer membrane protein